MFYPQKGIHHWMFPQAALSMVSNKGNMAKEKLQQLNFPPCLSKYNRKQEQPKTWKPVSLNNESFWWSAVRQGSGPAAAGQCGNRGKVPDPVPLRQAKTVHPPFSSSISLFPAPATSCQNHTPSNDMDGMEWNSARSATPFFHFTQDNA